MKRDGSVGRDGSVKGTLKAAGVERKGPWNQANRRQAQEHHTAAEEECKPGRERKGEAWSGAGSRQRECDAQRGHHDVVEREVGETEKDGGGKPTVSFLADRRGKP